MIFESAGEYMKTLSDNGTYVNTRHDANKLPSLKHYDILYSIFSPEMEIGDIFKLNTGDQIFSTKIVNYSPHLILQNEAPLIGGIIPYCTPKLELPDNWKIVYLNWFSVINRNNLDINVQFTTNEYILELETYNKIQYGGGSIGKIYSE